MDVVYDIRYMDVVVYDIRYINILVYDIAIWMWLFMTSSI